MTPVSPTSLMGAEGYMSVVTMMRSSSPDVQWKLVNMVTDEKMVAVCWLCSGTFTGNPPFVGARNKSPEQAADIETVFAGGRTPATWTM